MALEMFLFVLLLTTLLTGEALDVVDLVECRAALRVSHDALVTLGTNAWNSGWKLTQCRRIIFYDIITNGYNDIHIITSLMT